MSYFDHVKCHHCGAMLDPDKLAAGMTCPKCNGQLSLTDLFGVKDAFVGMDGGGNDVSLDALLAPGRLNPYAEDPLKQGQQAPAEDYGRQAQQPQGAGAPRTPQGPGRRALPMGQRGNSSDPGMVHVPKQGEAWEDDDDDVGGTPSALELMRKMKKRR